MNKRRSPLRPLSDHPVHMRTLATIVGLIFLSGFMVFVVNFTLFSGAPLSLEILSSGGQEFLNKILIHTGITLAVMTFFSGIILLIYFKQIMGPMHRLEKWLQRALEGDFSAPINFRKGDQFESVGLLLEELRKKRLKK